MVRFFVSVIAIWCVCFSLVFFCLFCLFCAVCFVFMWVFSRVPVVLVRHTDGRKVQRSRVCAILQVLSDGSLLSSSCSRVSQNSDTICFVLVIVETSGRTTGLIQKRSF